MMKVPVTLNVQGIIIEGLVDDDGNKILMVIKSHILSMRLITM